MLKTILKSPVCKTVILYTTLLSQQQICCFAGEQIPSAPPSRKASPDIGVGAERPDAFASIAAKARQSLVRLEVQRKKPAPDLIAAIPFELGGSEISPDQATSSTPRSQEAGQPGPANGSGVIVTEDGYIWTSSEVVRDASSVHAILATGESHPSKIVLVDQISGLAILKVAASGLTPLKRADQHEPRIAEWAMALSSSSDNDPIYPTGIVWLHEHATSSRGTRVAFFSYSFPGVQAEAGSAIVNSDGELIGIDVPPPRLFKPTTGTRYCLSSESALAIQRAILTAPITAASDSAKQQSVVSKDGYSSNLNQALHSLVNREIIRVNRSEGDTRDGPHGLQIFASNWIGEPVRTWADWLKDKWLTAVQDGGAESQ